MNRENWIREDGLVEDKLFRTHKQLRYKWRWSDIRHQNEASQVSLVEIYDWTIEAIHWHDNYEALILYVGENIASKKGFKTRLETQIEGEKLLYEWLTNEYNKIKAKYK